MAADSLFSMKKKTQSRDIHLRRGNLLVGQKVEVRRLGVGFERCWRSATVTGWRNSVRRVEYDHLSVIDGEPAKLVELVDVSTEINGGECEIDKEEPKRCRGLIRPVMCPSDVNKWSLHFGLCVDVCVKDSWCEGVVIDHEDGFDERFIFFPDLGNQKTISVEQLRVTRDWNEGLGCWTSLGNWLFLESLEDHGLDFLSGNVSLRQIWSNVCAKEEFQKRLIDWTCRERVLWDSFVQEVIRDMGLITKQVYNISDADRLKEVSSKRRKTSDSQFLPCGIVLGDSDEEVQSTQVVPCEAVLFPSIVYDDKNFEVGVQNRAGKEFMVPEAIGTVQDVGNNHGCGNDLISVEDEAEEVDFQYKINEDCSTNDSTRNVPKLIGATKRGEADWQPAGIDIIPGAKYCPEALVDYYAESDKRRTKDRNDIRKTKAKMHLLYMGWKIEFTRNGTDGRPKFRYISPDGEAKYSLVEVCKSLIETKRKAWNKVVENGHQNMVNVPGELLNSNVFQAVVKRFHKSRRRKVENPSEISSGRQKTPFSSIPEMEVLNVAVDEAEYCPQAVILWNEVGSDREKRKQINQREMTERVKKHLLAVGWRLWYTEKKNKHELRYTSPNGKTYISLVQACKACVEEENLFMQTKSQNGIIGGEESKTLGIPDKLSPSTGCFEGDESILPINGQSEKSCVESPGLSQPSLEANGIRRNQELQNSYPPHPPESGQIESEKSVHSQINQDKTAIEDSNATSALVEGHQMNGSIQISPLQSTSALVEGHQMNGGTQKSPLQSTKRTRRVLVTSQSQRGHRCVLSSLIDNNLVLPEDYVYYRGKNGNIRLAEGRITREGIRCNCCQEIFRLTGFEAHAGSTNHRPAANIFLEDGRSLFQCQKQLEQVNGLKSSKATSHERIKRNKNQMDNQSDQICSVCHYGGTLLLCEQCPSVFHLSCLGLKDVPQGQWFCPSCRCRICQQREFNGDVEQQSEKKVISCHQCERKYHVGCIRHRGLFKLEGCPKGSWFCSGNCEQIFIGLHDILGQSIPVGMDKLSWTILKSSEVGFHHLDASGAGRETMKEHRRKLKLGVEVMHECFEPVNEPGSERDIVDDVIFNKRSELNRMNFSGFYTLLLEREDEVISVATVRIYGDKVAEVPLVGTRFEYRRQGMCRILFNALEKTLAELGVERLVLPAAQEVLKTWTESFGFSEMTDSERLMLLEYTFLDFQGTIMCQKLLGN